MEEEGVVGELGEEREEGGVRWEVWCRIKEIGKV